MSRFRSQLSRLNAALAKRVLSELPHRPCSDATLLRAVRNCAQTGQGRLTVALYEGYRDTQTLPLKPELAAQLIRSLGNERLPHAPAAAGMAPLEHVRHPHRMRHPFLISPCACLYYTPRHARAAVPTPSTDEEQAAMLRLAFRVMSDTRSADATPPLDGDPCAVDLEPPRRHGQPPARPPRSGPSASRGSSRPPSPCWLAEVDAEARALAVGQWCSVPSQWCSACIVPSPQRLARHPRPSPNLQPP